VPATLASNRILPQLLKMTSTFDFLVSFIPVLQAHKEDLLKSTLSAPVDEAEQSRNDPKTLEAAIKQLLAAAVPQWDLVTAQPQPSHGAGQADTLRVVQLVKLCLMTRHVDICDQLLCLVLRKKTYHDFATYYPLVTQLRPLSLQAIEFSIPFDRFFRQVIGRCLGRYLKASPPREVSWKFEKVGCGCGDCRALDSFMLSSAQERTFRLGQSRRSHLKNRLHTKPGLTHITTVYTGNPHGLVVTKLAAASLANQWMARQRKAEAFLSTIGNEAVIAKIMGPRYEDVKKALAGTRVFVLDDPAHHGAGAAQTNVDAEPNLNPLQSVKPASPPSGRQIPTKVSSLAPLARVAESSSNGPAGHKRNREGAPIILDVIDLTADD